MRKLWKLKDGDPIDTFDIETTKISKKLAQTRKAATEKLTRARSKKAVPDKQAPPGFNKFKATWKGAERGSRIENAQK